MSPTERLIELYCCHTKIEIEEGDGRKLLDAFGVNDRHDLLQIRGYYDAYRLVSECASIVQAIPLRCPEPDEQVRESLRLLRRMVDQRVEPFKTETLQRLVEGRLRKGWPASQQAIYDEKKEILEWRDFFVSYTNRDASVINQQFQDLIKDCGFVISKDSKHVSNYLARVITRHLRRYQNLSGFYDENDLPVGDNITKDVERFCTNSFALIQVIEPLTFEMEPPPNWCFQEYTWLTENTRMNKILLDKNRHFFILTDRELSAIEPAHFDDKYQKWRAHIIELKHLHIALNDERNITLRGKIQQIAKQIVALRSEIIERWLA